MNIDFERFIKIAQSLSFTTFLILSVTAMSYAMFHLYTDTRTDWGQVQVNAQNIGQMSTNVEELVGKIDSLLNELHTCLRTGSTLPIAFSVTPAIKGFVLLPQNIIVVNATLPPLVVATAVVPSISN